MAKGTSDLQAKQMALLQITERLWINATTIAYEDLFKLSAILFFITLPCVLLLRVKRRSPAPDAVGDGHARMIEAS